jgi:uncharacterized LabA/DUF88 family protein
MLRVGANEVLTSGVFDFVTESGLSLSKDSYNAPGEPLKNEVPAGPLFFRDAAVMVDGEFFLKRLESLTGPQSAKGAVRCLAAMCHKHVERVRRNLYRVFFYDCEPFSKKLFNPISRKTIDYAKSPVYTFRTELHNLLRHERKFALRLGRLRDDENCRWVISSIKMNQLIKGEISMTDLLESDLKPNLRQKQVDQKIGLDIASLAYKKLVDTIILISGDADFVPAAKLARREGIDFILDPMGMDIQPELFEHIDGCHSVLKETKRKRHTKAKS